MGEAPTNQIWSANYQEPGEGPGIDPHSRPSEGASPGLGLRPPAVSGTGLLWRPLSLRAWLRQPWQISTGTSILWRLCALSARMQGHSTRSCGNGARPLSFLNALGNWAEDP